MFPIRPADPASTPPASRRVWPWPDMAHGQSIDIPASMRPAAIASFRYYKSINPGWLLRSRTIAPDIVRLWVLRAGPRSE